jgi:ATP-dependent RNA helicase DeaD
MKTGSPRHWCWCRRANSAIQVAEAFQKYAAGSPTHAGYLRRPELRAPVERAKRGPQVIVGTPGRIIDHLDRRT